MAKHCREGITSGWHNLYSAQSADLTTDLSVTWARVCVLPRHLNHLPASGLLPTSRSPSTQPPDLYLSLSPQATSSVRTPHHLQTISLHRVHSDCLRERGFLGTEAERGWGRLTSADRGHAVGRSWSDLLAHVLSLPSHLEPSRIQGAPSP